MSEQTAVQEEQAVQPDGQIVQAAAFDTVVFSDLAAARFESQREELHEGESGGPRTAHYEMLRNRFEEQHGEIVREFWGAYLVLGVAITVRRPRPRRGARGLFDPPRRTHARLHRATELVMLPNELEAAFAEGDTLAATAAEVLDPAPALTVLNHVFEAHRFLLGVVNSEAGLDPEWASRTRKEMQAAAKEGRSPPGGRVRKVE